MCGCKSCRARCRGEQIAIEGFDLSDLSDLSIAAGKIFPARSVRTAQERRRRCTCLAPTSAPGQIVAPVSRVCRGGWPLRSTSPEGSISDCYPPGGTLGGCRRKAQIRYHVWAYDFDGEANVVGFYVSYLCRKIAVVFALGPLGPRSRGRG